MPSRSYFKSLLHYPARWGFLQITLAFFVRNLSYEHASSRSSVFELLQALISKFDVGLMAKHAELFMAGFILCMANDAEKNCVGWPPWGDLAHLQAGGAEGQGDEFAKSGNAAAPKLNVIMVYRVLYLEAVVESSCVSLSGEPGESLGRG